MRDLAPTLAQLMPLWMFAGPVLYPRDFLPERFRGWLDWNKVLIETLTGFKRAGCDGILTYGAMDAARLLKAK